MRGFSVDVIGTRATYDGQHKQIHCVRFGSLDNFFDWGNTHERSPVFDLSGRDIDLVGKEGLLFSWRIFAWDIQQKNQVSPNLQKSDGNNDAIDRISCFVVDAPEYHNQLFMDGEQSHHYKRPVGFNLSEMCDPSLKTAITNRYTEFTLQNSSHRVV